MLMYWLLPHHHRTFFFFFLVDLPLGLLEVELTPQRNDSGSFTLMTLMEQT